ncbi:MAG: hypothetical protein H7Z41_01485 [Cytophagales bacterium]|nr:hypothetical protein [Armatimonadota bacterium]
MRQAKSLYWTDGSPEASEDDIITAAAAMRRAEERLEDYLDHLCASLLGVVPFPERQQIRRETRSHLEMLIEEFTHEGLSPTEAAETAFLEYGSPFQIGQSLVEAWRPQTGVSNGALATEDAARAEARQRGRIGRFTGSAPLIAFVACGLAAVASQASLHYCLSGAPRDHWARYPYVLAIYLAAPVVSGLAVGFLVPARGVSATLKVSLFTLPQAVLSGVLLLPHREGLWFALLQLAYGLPTSLLAVCGGEAVARYHRLQRFWKKKGPSWTAQSGASAAH